MSPQIKDKFEKLYTIILIVCVIICSVFIIKAKENYYIDEIISYILSNGVNVIQMEFEDGVKYSGEELPWYTYMAVSEESRFNLENVWINQKNDVHPPLYYVFFNLVCSLFPGRISNWFPGIINIAFYIVAAVYLNKISSSLISNRFINGIILLSVTLCYGMIQMNSFFRMYTMAMTWVSLISYLNVQVLMRCNIRPSHYIKLGIAVLLGALTHYYVIVFVVFQSVAVVIALYLLKRRRELPAYIAAMLLSGLHTLLLFPYMIFHIFTGGYRGQEAFANFGSTGTERFGEFMNILDEQLFGGLFFLIVIGLAVIVIYRRIKLGKEWRRIVSENKTRLFAWLTLVLPVVLFFFVVSKSAVFIVDRYIYPIYGIVLLIIVGGIGWGIWSVFGNKKIAKVVLGGIVGAFLVMGYRDADWPYLYHSEESRTALENADKYKECSCVYVYNAKWACELSFLEGIKYKDIVFYHQDSVQKITGLDGPTVIYVPIGKPEELIEQIMAQNPERKGYEVISEFSPYEIGYIVY